MARPALITREQIQAGIDDMAAQRQNITVRSLRDYLTAHHGVAGDPKIIGEMVRNHKASQTTAMAQSIASDSETIPPVLLEQAERLVTQKMGDIAAIIAQLVADTRTAQTEKAATMIDDMLTSESNLNNNAQILLEEARDRITALTAQMDALKTERDTAIGRAEQIAKDKTAAEEAAKTAQAEKERADRLDKRLADVLRAHDNLTTKANDQAKEITSLKAELAEAKKTAAKAMDTLDKLQATHADTVKALAARNEQLNDAAPAPKASTMKGKAKPKAKKEAYDPALLDTVHAAQEADPPKPGSKAAHAEKPKKDTDTK